MKLFSQMTTDESMDAMCIIAPHFQNILDDKELITELQRKLPKGEHTPQEIYRFGAYRIFVLLPIILKNHRADVYGVLSAFNGLSVEECGKQNLLTTMMQVRTLLNDKEFVNFFKSFTDSAQSA